MFGMLSAWAELQRELIVANTMDGLASARARGLVGGRRPKLNPGPRPHPTALRCQGKDCPADRRPVRCTPLDGGWTTRQGSAPPTEEGRCR
ncbi:hypothetical protein [Streptomyces chartreusis]|uniref:hypothetical protein n=1 Tax=Streptomyces chartreusis TaxID=1969 RepID=UPI003807140A